MGAQCHELQIEVTACPTCRYSYPNQGSNPCSQCYPEKVGRNASPKIVSKLNHRSASNGCGTTFNNAYDVPVPLSKQRVHLQQRIRKHLSTVTTVGHDTSPDKGQHQQLLQLQLQQQQQQQQQQQAQLLQPDQMQQQSSPFSCRTSKLDNRGGGGGASMSETVAGHLLGPARMEVAPAAAGGNHSPTSSLSFVIPPASIYALAKADQRLKESFYSSDDDLEIIKKSQSLLRMSGWYHPHLSYSTAFEQLMPTKVGTFLMRDSSDLDYLYSLSVQTKCGPTSIRIHYANGQFRLSASRHEAQHLPTFNCIIKLVEYYAELTNRLPLRCRPEVDENQNWVNIMGSGLCSSPVVLKKPHYGGVVPSLKHLSRLCVNRSIRDPNLMSVLQAPQDAIGILLDYPYKL